MSRGFNKSTRYGLYAAMEMARARPEAAVSVSQAASRYAIPVTVLAKVFQHLVHSGIAIGTRGKRGGYSLARPASQLTVLDVIEAFEPPRSAERSLLAEEAGQRCAEHAMCNLRKLFAEVDELSRCTYASVTLETLVGLRPRHARALELVK